jgi:hypothetical protein
VHCDSVQLSLQDILTDCGEQGGNSVKQQCATAWRWWQRWVEWTPAPPSECRGAETDPGEELGEVLLVL